MSSPSTGAPGADRGPGESGGEPNPRVLAGRYRLLAIVGNGAMGRVWAAHDEVLNRPVAIKEVDFPAGMPQSEVDQLAERTIREARAVASVSDPHVVTIFDMLSLPHGPAIVMELLSARSLAEILSVAGPMDDLGAAKVGLAVATGLLAAHSAGITHRDVKPGNVLICDDGRIKLTDFGIARSAGEQTITATGLLLGSPAYISPEVAAGRPANAQSDAWGLGALLFACVQGVPPFDRGTPMATLTAVVQDAVPAHPNSGRLGGVIRGLLVKDPATRMSVGTAHQVLLRTAADSGRLMTHAWKPPTRPATAGGLVAAAHPAVSSAVLPLWGTAPRAEAGPTGQHSTGQHSTGQHSAGQRSAGQHSPGQHSAGQHSAGQHVVDQRSTDERWRATPPGHLGHPTAAKGPAGASSSAYRAPPWTGSPPALPPPPWADAGASA
ncbi:MAG: serine/threonine protein kinase, partial [Actinomycetota bacterium]|nr:serine/threonine protein kinase [Actinomycetota bacterium]